MPRSLFRSTSRACLLACACSIAMGTIPASAQQNLNIPPAPLPDKKATPNFDPSDVYFEGYLLFKDGERLKADKRYLEALEKFKRAQLLFDNVATYFPTWKRDIVGMRREKTIEAINDVGPQALKENEKQARAIAELEGGVKTGVVEGEIAKPLGNALPPAPIQPAREVDTIESRRIAELENKVKGLQEELSAKPAPANNAQREQSRANDIARQRDVARAELQRANDELAQLRAKLAAAPMQEEINRLTGQINLLQKDKAVTDEALARSQEQTRIAKEQVAALQQERARLAQQVSDLERNLEVERKAQDQVIAGQQKKLREYQEEIRQADAKYAVAQQRIASLETDLAKLRGNFEALSEEHNAVIQERDQLRALLSQNEGSHVQTLIDKTMAQQRQLREAQEQIDRLNRENHANQDALTEAMRDFAIAKGNINDFKREKAAQDKRLSDLESRLRQEDRSLAAGGEGANTEEIEMLRAQIQKQLRIRDRQRQATEILIGVVEDKAKDDAKIADALALVKGAELQLSPDEMKLVQGHKIDDSFDASSLRKSQGEVDANVARLERENMPYTDAAKRAYLNERFESCRELFELVLERNPGDTDTRCRLGNVQLRLNDLPGASDTFRRASELGTTNPYAFRMLGYSLLEMGDAVQAIEPLKKSVELAPTNALGRVTLGRAYFEAGNEIGAEEELKSAIQFDDAMHQAHYNLAYLYAKQGKKKQGLEYYRNAVQRGAEPDLELEKSLGTQK